MFEEIKKDAEKPVTFLSLFVHAFMVIVTFGLYLPIFLLMVYIYFEEKSKPLVDNYKIKADNERIINEMLKEKQKMDEDKKEL